ncbi:NADH-quinone oxidoreductase subunit A [bacterium]|nr:NADH-quinone oxidoreductase subunit A [bacterium]
MLQQEYLYVLIFILGGSGMVLVAMLASWALRPSKPSKAKLTPYECGELPAQADSYFQFNIRYYLFALLFVVFDVEVVFFIPLVKVFNSIPVVAFVEITFFTIVLVFGLVYAWKKGALEWE